jgi:transmembrane sensor
MKFLPKKLDSQFLVRIIRNEVSPEEREFFEQWLEQSEENKEEFSNILLLWDSFQYANLPSLPPQQEQWEKIEQAILQHSDPEPAVPSFPGYINEVSRSHRTDTGSGLTWLTRIAAIIIIGITVFFISRTSVEKEIKSVTTAKQTPEFSIRYYTLSTAKGEKATLNLSDGSEITLNSDSRLRYPNFFGMDSREVEFEGEGYFKIASDKTRPFKVKCSNTTTIVTGTEFNIRNRDDELSITVVVGSVKTFSRKTSEGVDVIKGEMVSLQSNGIFNKPVKVDLSHSIAWRENKIYFSKTPLYRAAAELQRCYSKININIISDSIRNKTITGVFDTNSLEDILSVFSLTLDIRVIRKGHQIYFE